MYVSLQPNSGWYLFKSCKCDNRSLGTLTRSHFPIKLKNDGNIFPCLNLFNTVRSFDLNGLRTSHLIGCRKSVINQILTLFSCVRKVNTGFVLVWIFFYLVVKSLMISAKNTLKWFTYNISAMIILLCKIQWEVAITSGQEKIIIQFLAKKSFGILVDSENEQQWLGHFVINFEKVASL